MFVISRIKLMDWHKRLSKELCHSIVPIFHGNWLNTSFILCMQKNFPPIIRLNNIIPTSRPDNTATLSSSSSDDLPNYVNGLSPRSRNIIKSCDEAQEQLTSNVEDIAKNLQDLNHFVNLDIINPPVTPGYLKFSTAIARAFNTLHPHNNLPLNTNGTLTTEGVTMHQNTLKFYEKVNPVLENFNQNLANLNNTFEARNIPT